jgi:hypothetical protein
MNRDEIRAKILGAKPKTVTLDVFGTTIEIRQPSLRDIFQAQASDDSTKVIVQTIIEYCVVPGTNDKVFEAADLDVILSMPFGEDLAKLQRAITQLTGLDVEGAKEELKADPLH